MTQDLMQQEKDDRKGHELMNISKNGIQPTYPPIHPKRNHDPWSKHPPNRGFWQILCPHGRIVEMRPDTISINGSHQWGVIGRPKLVQYTAIEKGRQDHESEPNQNIPFPLKAK